MDPHTLQKQIFDEVIKQYPRKADAVEELSRLLSIGPNAVYRRIRGETQLSVYELFRIADRFDISLDSLFNNHSDKVIFTYSFFTKKISTIEDYVDQVLENAERIRKMSMVKIYYSSQEIPFFHYFAVPELFSFKMYVYALTYWDLEYLKNKKFSFDLFPQKVNEKAQRITSIYNLIESRELWSMSAVDHTLSQIEHFVSVGKFRNPDDALTLCDVLIRSVEHTREMAAAGRKFSLFGSSEALGQPLDFFYNEFSRTNETILIEAKTGAQLFTTFGTPNFLRTNDPQICRQIRQWFDAIISRSKSISVANELDRAVFFNMLVKRIGEARERLERLIKNG